MQGKDDAMPDLGFAGVTRRERLERIANAERDRRAGRAAVAAAAIGEPNEWPARVVLALTRLAVSDGEGARRLLEAGLDRWAREAGIGSLDAVEIPESGGPQTVETSSAEPERETVESAIAAPERETLEPASAEPERPAGIDPALERPLDAMPLADPFDSFELERAFEQAEVQIDEMLDVNRVAERVLMDEPVGLAELAGEPLEPSPGDAGGHALEAGAADLRDLRATEAERMDAAWVADPRRSTAPPAAEASRDGRPSRSTILATLEKWLHNLERGRAGGAR
jgi:hypothetical protein